MNKRTKQLYQFTLILKNVDEDTPNLEDSLYKAGCDDALINFRNGTVYLDFDRRGTSFKETILVAIRDVESSSVHAIVANVAPENLVTISDIAKRLNKKRQVVSLWIKGERRKSITFPKPIMKLSDCSPLWKWSEVSQWLYQNRIIDDKNIVNQAIFIEDLNASLEVRGVNKKLREELLKEIGTLKVKEIMLQNFENHNTHSPQTTMRTK